MLLSLLSYHHDYRWMLASGQGRWDDVYCPDEAEAPTLSDRASAGDPVGAEEAGRAADAGGGPLHVRQHYRRPAPLPAGRLQR